MFKLSRSNKLNILILSLAIIDHYSSDAVYYIFFCISCMRIGLVDANNADDFRAKLLTVKESWNAKEQQYLPTGFVATFYDYIVARVRNKKQYTYFSSLCGFEKRPSIMTFRCFI